MKTILVLLIAGIAACSSPSTEGETAADSMPVVKPDTVDTSRVMTPPPTGDSNVVDPGK